MCVQMMRYSRVEGFVERAGACPTGGCVMAYEWWLVLVYMYVCISLLVCICMFVFILFLFGGPWVVPDETSNE